MGLQPHLGHLFIDDLLDPRCAADRTQEYDKGPNRADQKVLDSFVARPESDLGERSGERKLGSVATLVLVGAVGCII